MTKFIPFETLQGKVLKEVHINHFFGRCGGRGNTIDFVTADGETYMLYSYEAGYGNDVRVWVEDMCGDVSAILGEPILLAECVTQKSLSTWTFYKLATNRGYLTIRWCGESNGYYSEEVNFERVEDV